MILGAGRSSGESMAPQADLSRLREGISAVELGTSQVTILQEMLKRAYVYCKRCALFVVREQNRNMIGWAALGFTGCGDMPDAAIKKVSITFDQDTVLNEIYRTSRAYNGTSNQQKDNLQLFDDGNHNDGNAGDSLFANVWPVSSAEERQYYVDLQVTQVDPDTLTAHDTLGEVTLDKGIDLLDNIILGDFLKLDESDTHLRSQLA